MKEGQEHAEPRPRGAGFVQGELGAVGGREQGKGRVGSGGGQAMLEVERLEAGTLEGG